MFSKNPVPFSLNPYSLKSWDDDLHSRWGMFIRNGCPHLQSKSLKFCVINRFFGLFCFCMFNRP